MNSKLNLFVNSTEDESAKDLLSTNIDTSTSINRINLGLLGDERAQLLWIL